jgi:hypothetical protein
MVEVSTAPFYSDWNFVEEKIEFITSLLLHSVSWLFGQSSGSFNDRQHKLKQQ